MRTHEEIQRELNAAIDAGDTKLADELVRELLRAEGRSAEDSVPEGFVRSVIDKDCQEKKLLSPPVKEDKFSKIIRKMRMGSLIAACLVVAVTIPFVIKTALPGNNVDSSGGEVGNSSVNLVDSISSVPASDDSSMITEVSSQIDASSDTVSDPNGSVLGKDPVVSCTKHYPDYHRVYTAYNALYSADIIAEWISTQTDQDINLKKFIEDFEISRSEFESIYYTDGKDFNYYDFFCDVNALFIGTQSVCDDVYANIPEIKKVMTMRTNEKKFKLFLLDKYSEEHLYTTVYDFSIAQIILESDIDMNAAVELYSDFLKTFSGESTDFFLYEWELIFSGDNTLLDMIGSNVSVIRIDEYIRG